MQHQKQNALSLPVALLLILAALLLAIDASGANAQSLPAPPAEGLEAAISRPLEGLFLKAGERFAAVQMPGARPKRLSAAAPWGQA